VSQYELHGVAKLFTRGDVLIQAVHDVDLTIEPGELVALEGPSGSGKTTLLQLLGALDRPSSGRIVFEGRDFAALADRELAELRLRSFGFVFQQFNLIPTLTAAENVEAKLAPTGVEGRSLRERAQSLLAEVGLADRATHLPSHLSGGEQQRVAIARALSVGPRVILADEPTGNLDSQTGADVIELLAGLAAQRGTTVVVATHDTGLAGRAPRRLAMRDGGLPPSRPCEPCGESRTRPGAAAGPPTVTTPSKVSGGPQSASVTRPLSVTPGTIP
jgi:putative ABC transport system ATP-binding protein